MRLQVMRSEPKLFAVSCQLLLFIETTATNRKGKSTSLLLPSQPFPSSSSLNNSAVQAVDSWPLRAAQCPCHLHQTLLSLERRSCACKGGRRQWEPPVRSLCHSSFPLCLCLVILEMCKLKSSPKKAASLPCPAFSKEYQAQSVQAVCYNQAPNVAAS